MADDVPTALKQADLNLFKTAQRGAQLQAHKPIVTYWCNYWVVNQILAKGLHNTDAEILEYTTSLMDKLEEAKSTHAHEDAITDDAAGQAYLEQFAQETLDRAQRVVKANKVTVQTGQTFDAAATFVNLANIWGPLDTENLQKIKYAKWNAARIYKAIKEGKNPNESNPKPEELPEQPPPLDANDPEVQLLAGTPGSGSAPTVGTPGAGSGPRPVSVEDVPDKDMRRDSAGVSLPHSPVSATHSTAAQDELTLPSIPASAPGNVPQFIDPVAPQPGYFDNHTAPQMPSPMSPPSQHPANYQQQPSIPPSAPGWVPTPSPPPNQSAFSPPPIDHTSATSASLGPPTFASNQQPTPAVAPPPMSVSPDPSYMNMAPTAASVGRPAIPPPSAPSAGSGYHAAPPAGFVPDDLAMAAAQKHAKWAISALNFEDVPTAIRELRNALAKLGAS